MRILLDTHALLWWLFDSPKLCQVARSAIASPDNDVYVSSASAWEIAIKHRLGKLPEATTLIDDYHGLLNKAFFKELTITSVHALQAGGLAIAHRDPFDRMLMAQALLENMPIVTYDQAFKRLDLQRIPD